MFAAPTPPLIVMDVPIFLLVLMTVKARANNLNNDVNFEHLIEHSLDRLYFGEERRGCVEGR